MKMLRTNHLLAKSMLFAFPLVCLGLNTTARAYVDLAPTLTRVISDSRKITLVEVVSLDREKHTVVLKEVSAFKGTISADPISHDVAAAQGGAIPRYIRQWASPGSRAVLFSSGTSALVCFGEGWYLVRNINGAWKLGPDRPDLPLAYYGPLSKLTDSIQQILAGKSTIITVVAYGADNEGASFDLALNRQNLPGLVRLQRIRASQNMPSSVASASANPTYFVGPGAVDEAELPTLIENLKSSDAILRAQSADDLRLLGRKTAASAAAPLAALLADSTPRVRFSAAAALLVITPSDSRGLDVLAKGLASPQVAERLAAARSTGFAGKAAGPLTDKLAALLKDPDEAIRISALQSITLLGPAAAQAAPAITPLLDSADWQIDAADALGRIGTAARPALPQLTKMLASDKPTVQWAAVRAMSQIGGPDAHPAVDYMIRALPKATEVEGYNMMIYLSLLGPVATDATAAIQNTPLKNPVLPSATIWAMAPDKNFPWLSGGGMGGRGGRGGRGGFGGGPGGPGGPGGGGGFGPADANNDPNGQGFGGQGGNFNGQGGPGGFNGQGNGPGNFNGGGQGGPDAQGNFNGGPGGGPNNFNGPGGGGGGGGGRGGRGGPGGGGGGFGGGPGGGADIFSLIYEAYVHELGDRLQPAAAALAKKIMDGSAGDVPLWGYKILACGPDDALKTLTPYLSDSDQIMRERATVAIGYMGETAAPAKKQLEAALTKASSDREKNLIQWSLREIATD